MSDITLIGDMLRKVGVKQNDVVLLHSDITPYANVMRADFASACHHLYEQLTHNVDTLIVPTFNYDFSTYGSPYNHETTRSQVGLFTHYCLFHKDLHRSFHPVFSFASTNMFHNIPKDAFGKESMFDRLYNVDRDMGGVKIIMLSVPATQMTFVHYIEQRLNVWYRYKKYFTGQVTKNGETWTDTFSIFVRDLEHNVQNNFAPVMDRLEKCGIIRRYEYPPNPKLYMLAVSCRDLFDAVRCEIVQNPNAMITYED